MSEENKYTKNELLEKELIPHIDALSTFAFHLTYNEADANDLVQETYFKAIRAIHSFQEGTNAKAWLFKIMKNSFINDFRKRSRRPKILDIDDQVNISNVETAVSNLDSGLYNLDEIVGDEVLMALNSLAIEYRTIILLSDVEGFTYEEISKILDKPMGTVRSRLFRARNLLKDKLKNYAISFGYKDKRLDKKNEKE